MKNKQKRYLSQPSQCELGKVTGPTFFEVEYLRQMKDELQSFLRAKGFDTIREFEIGFRGNNYSGHMTVRA